MDLHVHEAITWRACLEAHKLGGLEADPLAYFPLLARGSWLNDTNQSSIFTNTLKGQKDKVQAFLRELWTHDCERLLERMAHAPGSTESAVLRAKTLISPASGACDDLGNYDFRDHMDVLNDQDVDGECREDAHGRSRTIVRSLEHANERFNTWQNANKWERLNSWRFAVALGRAIHTVQDFYAHSNYVELLLWTLSAELPREVVASFNDPVPYFEDEPYERCYCPLPPKRSDDPTEYARLTANNTMFWYGPSPAETPLLSTVFVTNDTACSLLEMYAGYLEHTEGSAFNSGQLDALMAIFSVPGRPLAVAAMKVYEGFQSVLQPLGSAVRGWLADALMAKASTLQNTAAGVVEAASCIVREYDNAKASDWARAGRLRYVSYALQRGMASELARDHSDATMVLPHHSLLRKDYPLNRPDDAARVRLACALASKATLELIHWAFSGEYADKAPRAIVDRYIRHPRHQVDTQEAVDRLTLFTRAGVNLRWPELVEKSGVVV